MTPPASVLRPVLAFGPDDAATTVAMAARIGLPLTLVGPPGAGTSWFLELIRRVTRPYPSLPVTAILDCGDRAGEAQGALAAGVRHVLFRGHPQAAARLQAISAALGATLLTDLPPALDLRGHRTPEAVLTAWLSGRASAGG